MKNEDQTKSIESCLPDALQGGDQSGSLIAHVHPGGRRPARTHLNNVRGNSTCAALAAARSPPHARARTHRAATQSTPRANILSDILVSVHFSIKTLPAKESPLRALRGSRARPHTATLSAT
ncbi:hypothetical protein EVAR_33236_1 [Eumeta japonica]|uniref:Uncharacterized protein n=1 Tax=Eumeta variegata TaxID=151549 RepID=A0A4C1W242_EUMVA|nr:hypothetical protein EVAR_33236_1 [Eumeta japonica]